MRRSDRGRNLESLWSGIWRWKRSRGRLKAHSLSAAPTAGLLRSGSGGTWLRMESAQARRSGHCRCSVCRCSVYRRSALIQRLLQYIAQSFRPSALVSLLRWRDTPRSRPGPICRGEGGQESLAGTYIHHLGTAQTACREGPQIYLRSPPVQREQAAASSFRPGPGPGLGPRPGSGLDGLLFASEVRGPRGPLIQTEQLSGQVRFSDSKVR